MKSYTSFREDIEDNMERVLLVCDSDKAREFCLEVLKKQGYPDVFVCTNGGEAKRRLLEHEYDFAVINAPLRMESAENVSVDIASKNLCQVILLIKNEYFDEAHAHTRDAGVITVAKPIHPREFAMAIDFSFIARARIGMIKNENKKLLKKINELKYVSKAKLLLIEVLGISEEEAHKKIEKTAMDERKTRLAVAKDIIDYYE